MNNTYGVFGLNQFQLLWDTQEKAEIEAARLSLKHNKRFSVMVVVSHFDNGEPVNGNG